MSIFPLFVFGVIIAALFACFAVLATRSDGDEGVLSGQNAIGKTFRIPQKALLDGIGRLHCRAQGGNGCEPKRRITRRVRTRNGLSVALGQLFAAAETGRNSRAR
ncbi:MAG: hypothetical protein FWD68_01905 [Alphaproteobacteria bacterium]|nr:hypothetical protein [Alphaproteobacteria bacterium]